MWTFLATITDPLHNTQALEQLSLYRMQSGLQENVHSVNLKLFCPSSS